MKLKATVSFNGEIHKISDIMIDGKGNIRQILTLPEKQFGPYYRFEDDDLKDVYIELKAINENGDIKTHDDFILRKLLWLRHGCSFPNLYGDDGEMQCHACMIDFKRDHIGKIEHILLRPQPSLQDSPQTGPTRKDCSESD